MVVKRLPVVVDDSLRDRFSRMVCVKDNGCWVWLGAQRNGYGAIKHHGRAHSAHVVSFVIHGGQLEDGKVVKHSCDNKLCVNPSHLTIGTYAENRREAHVRRGQNYLQGREAHGAVLTESQVQEILAISLVLRWSTSRLASRYGVNRSTTRDVLAGKSWGHVQRPTVELAKLIVANSVGVDSDSELSRGPEKTNSHRSVSEKAVILASEINALVSRGIEVSYDAMDIASSLVRGMEAPNAKRQAS